MKPRIPPFKALATAALNSASSWRAIFGKAVRWCREFLWRIEMKKAEMHASRQEPRLFNAARKQPAWQSSTRGNNKRFGAGKGTNGRAGTRAVFATKREAHPWWMVKLEASWPLHSIHIHKRRGSVARAATLLQVSTSVDEQRWEVVYSSRHHFGDVASPGPLVIRLLEALNARFVKVELPEGGELVLNQVEVMVDERHRHLFRTACRYGFNFEYMISRPKPRRFGPYSVRNVRAGFDGKITAFHIAVRSGRFGNNLLQIGGAVRLAQHLGVRRVYVMKLPMLEVDQPMKFGEVVILPEARLEKDRPAGLLCGSFFHREQFGEASTALGFRHLMATSRTVGQPIFHRQAVVPAFVPEETDLAIHLRSGDIFARRHPHLGYVQPPLAFYRMCVGFARAELGTRRVILVYEDDANPCVGALKAWLSEIGFPHVSQSGTLEQDMAVLLAARHCVFGHGFFGLTLTLLSKQMKTVIFSWLEPRFSDVCDLAGVRAVGIDDIGGGFTKLGEWRNTPEQIRMMLDYPIENLRFAVEPSMLPTAESPRYSPGTIDSTT